MGHRVARSTIASILKSEAFRLVLERLPSWRTFLCAHWPALMAADFSTTAVLRKPVEGAARTFNLTIEFVENDVR